MQPNEAVYALDSAEAWPEYARGRGTCEGHEEFGVKRDVPFRVDKGLVLWERYCPSQRKK